VLWLFGLSYMCLCLGVVGTTTEDKARQAVSLAFALDPHKGSI
jgi:hypothetical protein